MTIIAADVALNAVWPDVWPLLEPAVQRSSDKPDVLSELRGHHAQLWAVIEDGRACGAVVTKVHDVDGEKRCLFWLVGGVRAGEWAQKLVDVVRNWAWTLDCAALWGVGRRGWARHMRALGFERIEDFEGQPAWRRAI